MTRYLLTIAMLVWTISRLSPEWTEQFKEQFFKWLPSIINVIEDSLSDETLSETRVRSDSDLRKLASQLRDCAKMGPSVKAYAAGFHGSPTERLIKAYSDLRQRWSYRPDGEFDTHQSAETTIGKLNYEGDCEDFAVTMMAVLSAIDGLDSRIVLCNEDQPGEGGHGYCEVLIAKNRNDANRMIDRLRTAWKLDDLEFRRDSLGQAWVALDFQPPAKNFRGRVLAVIGADGSIEIY